MAEPITMQKLIDADVDADTLGEFANEDKIVTSRLGAEYPSAPMASRMVVENGLLGATPFSTYAAMTASALADGDYAVVTNEVDTKKNGVYEKIDGVWVYSQYNPMSYTDKANDMRVSADSAQIAASADLLEPSSENIQFEIKNGSKQILRVEDDRFYADFYTKDGVKLESTNINAVQSVYDLYSVDDSNTNDDLSLYDGDELVVNLTGDKSEPDEPYTATESIFYIDDEQLKYADAKDSYLVDTTAKPLNIASFTPKACLAVTNNQWFKTGQSVVTLGANGCQYPNPNKVLVIVPSYGQSLAAGSKGVPPISLINPQPDYALMFDGINARLDSSGNLGRTPLTDFSKAIGFEPIAVKNNTSNASDDLSKELLNIPFAHKITDILAKENDAPIRLLTFTAAVGGTLLDMSDKPELDQTGLGLKKGSNAYANLTGAISKAKQLAEAQGWDVVVPTILWQHGEGDSANENYALRLNQFISDINADVKDITKQTQDIYIYALLKANHYASLTVGLEQSMLVGKDNPLFKIIGSTYPAEPAAWDGDFTHRSARGYNYLGYMYAKAFYRELRTGFGSFKGLTFKSATIAAKVISVKLDVPVAPIKYKANDVVLADTNWGFRVLQGGTELPISSVAIAGPDTVSITLANVPSSGELTIECAMYGHAGSPNATSIPRSNICDSDTTFGLTKGGDSTENWLVPFKTTITV